MEIMNEREFELEFADLLNERLEQLAELDTAEIDTIKTERIKKAIIKTSVIGPILLDIDMRLYQPTRKRFQAIENERQRELYLMHLEDDRQRTLKELYKVLEKELGL